MMIKKNNIPLLFVRYFVYITICSSALFAQQVTPTIEHKNTSLFNSYSFSIENGVNSPIDASRLDGIVMTMKGLVIKSETNFVTKKARIWIANPKITYRSLKYFIDKQGFTASKEYVFIKEGQ